MILAAVDETALIIALVVAFTSLVTAVVAPVLMSYVSFKQRKAEREADWERQDEVASNAAKASALLLDAQKKAARVTADNAELTGSKLDVIHTLVNSQLSTALENELEALKREQAIIAEMLEMKKAQGLKPSKEALVAMEKSKVRIAELQTIIAERDAQQRQANKQTEDAAAARKKRAPRTTTRKRSRPGN